MLAAVAAAAQLQLARAVSQKLQFLPLLCGCKIGGRADLLASILAQQLPLHAFHHNRKDVVAAAAAASQSLLSLQRTASRAYSTLVGPANSNCRRACTPSCCLQAASSLSLSLLVGLEMSTRILADARICACTMRAGRKSQQGSQIGGRPSEASSVRLLAVGLWRVALLAGW